MQRAPARVPRYGTWAGGLALAGMVGAFSGGVATGAPTQAGWASYTKGLDVHGVTCLRIPEKTPDAWFASVWGSGTAKRGFCESRDKGKTWVARSQGFEEGLPSRTHFEIALDPKDAKTAYVVAGGKIYKTVNAGQSFEGAYNGTNTWSFDAKQSGYWVAGVLVDESNPKHLLAGTLTHDAHGGLFESADAGQAWRVIAGTAAGKETGNLGHDAWPLAMDSKSDKYLVACGRTFGSVWASDDRGRKFKRADPGGPGWHTAYAITPMVSKESLLAESRGLWRTRDGGETWGKNPVLAGTVISVAQDPANHKQAYAIVRGAGLYRTENLTSWEGPKHPEVDAHEVVCHPTQKNTLFLLSRTTGLWISTDRGESVTQLLGENASGVPPAVPAVACAAVHPADPNEALAVADTGAVFTSKDRGATWALGSLLGVPIACLSPDPATAGVWLAAGPGVWRTADAGAKWQRTLQVADPEDRVVAVERGVDGTVYVLWERDARIFTSKDGGQTWEKAPIQVKGAPTDAWGASLAVDARDARHLFVALKTPFERPAADDQSGGPYESKDGGQTWACLSAGFKGDKGQWREGWTRGAAAGIDPLYGVLYYGVDGLGFFRWDPSAGDKAQWEEVAIQGAPAGPEFSAFLVALTHVGATARSEVLCQLEGTAGRGLYRSLDAGKTFTLVADPGARVTSLSMDPSVDGRLFAGDMSGDLGVRVFEPAGSAPAPIPAGGPPPTPPPAVPPANPPPGPGPTPTPAPPSETPVEGLVAFSGGDDGLLKAWDLHTGKGLPVALKHDKAVRCAVLSRDETRFYTGGDDRTIRVWDAKTGQALGAWQGHPGAVLSLALSADGKRLYAGDTEWKIYVWDTTNGKTVARYEEHIDSVTALALSPDGKTLYSASKDDTVRIWDLAAGKTKVAIPGHPGDVLCLGVSSDGKRLYTGGPDKSVRVFDAATGADVATWSTKQGHVLALVLSPDGTTLYVAGDGKDVETFSTADGKPGVSLSGGDKGQHSLAVSADGKWLVAGGGDGLVRLWRAGTPGAHWVSPDGHKGPVHAIALTFDVEKPGGAPPAPGTAPPAPPTPPAMGEAPPPPAMGEPLPPAMGEAPPAMGQPPPAMAEPPSMGNGGGK